MAVLDTTSGEAVALMQRPGESWQQHDSRLNELIKRGFEHTRQLKAGNLIGAVISFPVADGKAFYKVTSVSPLTLLHIPIGDAYQIPAAHVRGLDVEDVSSMVETAQRWATLAFR